MIIWANSLEARGQGRGRPTTGVMSTKRIQPASTRSDSIAQPALTSKPTSDEIRQADLDRENLSARREKVSQVLSSLCANAPHSYVGFLTPRSTM